MGEKLTVVDGKQYREVSRKANVGELVKITNAVEDAKTLYGYGNGETYEVKKASPRGDGEIDIWPDGTINSEIYLNTEEYVVLEPVESADDLRALLDGLTETVASLTLRVTELERKAGAPGKYALIASGPVSDSKPSFVPKTRDEIVEQAKKDVAELTYKAGRAKLEVNGTERYVNVKFHVNNAKRTVVALMIGQASGRVWARGKSRCAPDDCFNAHIGRAIALRRALGLTVPDEYFQAPQPTKFNAGDVVKAKRYYTEWTATLTERNESYDDYSCGDAWNHTHDGGWVGEDQIVVIDDSREEVSA